MSHPDPYDRTDPKAAGWADDLEDRADTAREAGQ